MEIGKNTTGNLNYRKDVTRNITENFGYDNLNRLTGFGGQTVTYDPKGNITQKSGIGNYHYLNNAKPYALTGIVQSGNVIPERQQQITYASFSRPLTIAEDGYTAQFIYEAGGDRVKMQVTQNGAPVLTRHYLANQYELDEKPGSTREKFYLGGDYYSAGGVLVRDNGGAWQVFYINSDYLGSVTHVVNSTGNVVGEYSYDAWGRLRNPVTHAVYGDGQQPELFLGRGYTGHEHLGWFGLINMNARLYDPVHGRFLAPDPYVQAPDFTQSFNRYGYAWGNPLKHNDPSGEFIIVDSWVNGFIRGLFKGGLKGAWKQANKSAANDAKIWGGLFKGSFKQILSRFTWELPQTLLGFTFSHFSNTTLQNVDNVSYYGGATVLRHYKTNGLGVTLGSYINGDATIRPDPDNSLFQHEYGHYLQSMASGILYLPKFGIPSLLSKNKPGHPHTHNPVEQDANIRAIQHFFDKTDGKVVWDFEDNPIGTAGRIWSMGDYHSFEFQQILNLGRMHLNFEDIILGWSTLGIYNAIKNNKTY